MRQSLRGAFGALANNSVWLGLPARRLRRWVHVARNKSFRRGNLVMLHAGRCGSSVLADMLNQHPEMRWANEPFEVMTPAYRAMPARHRAAELLADRMYRQRIPYFGFDMKYLPEQHMRREMANQTPDSLMELLEGLDFRYFVLLTRRNHLRRAVSAEIGRKRGYWNTFDAVKDRVTVRLDPQRFLSYGRETPLVEYFRGLDEAYEAFRSRLADRHLLELVYEQDVQNDPAIGYGRICSMLGIEPRAANVRLKRINPQPLSQLIENFGEVEAALAGSPYAWMTAE